MLCSTLYCYRSVVWLIMTDCDRNFIRRRHVFGWENALLCSTNPIANKKRKSWSVKILPQIFAFRNRYDHVTDSRWHLKCVSISHTTLVEIIFLHVSQQIAVNYYQYA